MPTLIIRDITDRPEAFGHGGNLMPMNAMGSLPGAVEALLVMRRTEGLGGWCDVFGDGHAGERIAQLAVDYCRRAAP